MRKKTICLSISVLILFFIAGGVINGNSLHVAGSESDRYQVNRAIKPSEAFLKNQAASVEAYNGIIDYFNNNKGPHPKDGQFHYSADGLYAKDYPDYYSGAYLNVDGELVIRISRTVDERRASEGKEVLSAICKAANVVFRDAEYSYSDLIDCMTDIYCFVEGNEYLISDYSIMEFEILDDQNRVGIFLNSVDEKVLSVIRGNIRNSECVVFSYQEDPLVSTASLKCGQGIGKAANSTTMSIGYPAVYTSALGDTTEGFITCGHAFATDTTTVSIYSGSTYIGLLNPSKKQFSGTVDAAFIMLSGSQVTHSIYGTTHSISSGSATIPVGGYARSSGASSGYRYGTVSSTSASGSVSGVTLYDLVKAGYSSVSGDSGGIVYKYNGGNDYLCAGITDLASGSNSFYCKVSNINSALGVSVN